MRKHIWSDPDAIGAMVCKNCGAIKYTDIKGWYKTAAILDGKRQPYCPMERAGRYEVEVER